MCSLDSPANREMDDLNWYMYLCTQCGHIYKSTGKKSMCPVCRYEDKSGGAGVLSCMSVVHVLTGMAVLHFHVLFRSIIKFNIPSLFCSRVAQDCVLRQTQLSFGCRA